MFAVDFNVEAVARRRMGWADFDAACAALAECERVIARARARQVEILAMLHGQHAERTDRHRSMEDMLVAEVDVSHATARDLMAAARRWESDEDLCTRLQTGEDTFDRSVATAALVAAGGTPDDVSASRDRDIPGVRKQAAHVRKVTRVEERQVAKDRFLKIEPTMGDTAWRISGLATAVDGAIIAKALERRGDEVSSGAGWLRPDRGQRMVDALTTMALDVLDPVGDETGADAGTDDDHGDIDNDASSGPPPRRPGRLGAVNIFVDAARAETTSGEIGARIAAGPRVGPGALERILCGGTVGIVALDTERNPIGSTPQSRYIPPAVRALVLDRDDGCVMAGCRSRYRLEPHHIHPYSYEPDHTPPNLATLCWFHHHIAIHLFERLIDPDSPPQARRFLRPWQITHRGPPPCPW